MCIRDGILDVTMPWSPGFQIPTALGEDDIPQEAPPSVTSVDGHSGVVDLSATYAARAMPLSGDFTGTLTAPEIAPSSVTDTEVSPTAAIARSKLASVEAIRRVGAGGQPAFAGTWGNFNTGYETAGFWKDESSGLVRLTGLVKCTGTDVTVFTLPVGYRPAGTAALLFTMSKVVVSTLSLEQVTISLAGAVIVGTAAVHVTQTLDGICFRAA